MSNIEIKGNAAEYLRRIADALEGEQAFWDRAFAAALTGLLAENAHPSSPGTLGHDGPIIDRASEIASIAVRERAARRARTEGEQDE